MFVTALGVIGVALSEMSSNPCKESEAVLKDLFGASSDDESDSDSEAGSTSAAATLGTNTRISAVVQLPDVGGKRGVVALCRIPPGVLLLAETPTATWNSNNLEEEDLLAAVEACLSIKIANETIKTLHPINLTDCDTEEIERAEELIGRDKITGIALKVSETNEEVLRVVLALQHNGFGSGLYGVLTMLNHSCSPNCIKFSPSVGSSGASEVWTVKQIEENEELTICYSEPLEMTKESMREYLEVHHRFQCTCTYCQETVVSENYLSDEKQFVLQRMRVQESKLQDIIIGMEQELSFLRNIGDVEVAFESVVKLMKASTDLSSIESDECVDGDFPVNHRIMARLNKIAANAAVLFLDYADRIGSDGRKPKEILIKAASFSFLRNSLSLLSNQKQYLSEYHPDIASSYIDIAEALECCVGHFSDDVIEALNAPVLDDFPELHLLQISRPSHSLSPAAAVVAAAAAAARVAEEEGVGANSDAMVGAGAGPGVRVAAGLESQQKKVTVHDVKKEANRFRAEGTAIKNLYVRTRFPSRLKTLLGGRPGVCHWGDFIPPDHSKLLVDVVENKK